MWLAVGCSYYTSHQLSSCSRYFLPGPWNGPGLELLVTCQASGEKVFDLAESSVNSHGVGCVSYIIAGYLGL